ncbi:MAG: hypothetical protein V3R79_09090, partial [Alphaproteobacteria bacterium]
DDGDDNAFFGLTDPDYFVFQSVGGATDEFAATTTTYFPNVVAHVDTTETFGTRTTRTLNGFAGGLSQRIDSAGNVISAFMFGNTNDLPTDIAILTDATTGTLTAVFDVQKIGAVGDDNHLVASFGGAGRSAFFDDESFGAFESGTPAQFTTVTNPAVNPFLVGGHLYQTTDGVTGAHPGGGFRFTSNSSDFGTVFPIDLVGDFPDAGVVPTALEFELHEGENVFDFTASSFNRPFYGLSLFFNDTGVSFNPALGSGVFPGDLVAFTTGDADAGGGSTGFGTPSDITFTHDFDSAGGTVLYSGATVLTLPDSQVSITNFEATNVFPFFPTFPNSAEFTASFTITVVSSGPTGPAVTGTDLYMVTSGAFRSNGFPGAASECACQFLEWGFWGGEIRFATGDRERIHLANWVAGDNIASGAILDGLPAGATATYNGHLIGTVLNAGDVYQAMGGFGMTFNFDNPTASTINVTGFDTVDYNAGVSGLQDGIYQASGADTSALSRTINFTGAFFGGGGDPVAETGGQFNVDGGANYSASGIFAGAQ